VTARSPLEQFTAIVVNGLADGKAVEVDGLGVFYPDSESLFRFEPCTRPRVFIAYAKEDATLARRLYDEFETQGFRPWMDTRKLLPGQNWPRAIEAAIEISDFFVACFSRTSANKRGGFQAEIRYALDCARHAPLDEIFMVPVRLEPCRVPRSIQREIQYVDLYPDWEAGIARLAGALQAEWRRRNSAITG
jgi:hypothetical protein